MNDQEKQDQLNEARLAWGEMRKYNIEHPKTRREPEYLTADSFTDLELYVLKVGLEWDIDESDKFYEVYDKVYDKIHAAWQKRGCPEFEL